MTAPRIDRDAMVLLWDVGDEDTAMALLKAEGMTVAMWSGAPMHKLRTAWGWSLRVAYAVTTRGRFQKKGKREATSCEG